jgi:predicted dithiol-disulfide oxidoreductase (DUF899 family)
MVHTMVDGTLRQTNLTNESREYLAKREELRLAEIELMSQRERVAELRRHLSQARRLRITNLKKAHATSTLATHRRATSASANFSRGPVVHSSSIT